MQSDPAYREKMFSLVEAWRSSGQPQQAFCNEQGITYHRFGYWHKRYREHNKATAAPAPAPAFVPFSITSPATTAVTEIIYPDGRRLLFHQGVDASFLKTLLS
jgi:hypothetical protein